MNPIVVYHGGTDVVDKPICSAGRANLDFGRGFYLTDIRKQAVSWARNIKDLRRASRALLNVYKLDKEAILKEAKCKIFTAYDEDWLDFIIANRNGENAAAQYDYIEGGVANDRVINSINMFMQGYYSKEYTLRLLSLHQPNNQICITSQELIDKYLHYERTETA